ncbi:MAG: Hsp20/alpha crystallin family protein [Myxococcota bacterium]
MKTHVLVPRRRTLAPALAWNHFDRVFDSFWKDFGNQTPVSRPTSLKPRVDFKETETEMVVAAEMPGLEEENISVSFEEGVLTLRGEHAAEEAETDAEGARHVETARGTFERRLRFHAEVDADAIKAVYKAGILTVTLPKVPEAKPEVHTIPVTSS